MIRRSCGRRLALADEQDWLDGDVSPAPGNGSASQEFGPPTSGTKP
jgi:hypothetical protein